MASSSSSRPVNLEVDAFAEILYQGENIGSSASPKLFDVFINHRGPDVKETLALELYNYLEKVGIRAFLDCKEMDLGDLFPSTIQNAIYSASVQIAIFSKRYAQSVWCLAELSLMLKTKRKIIPIFYDVRPSDLRYVEKGVYANSFKYYRKKRRHLDKLDAWKEALRCVSFICGYEFDNNNGLETLCKKIVSAVRREVERTRPLEIARYPTGVEKLVEDFERTCWQKEGKDKVIGIYGMGGSGKTTLVRELFNQKRSEFSASCFLFDVREAKLTSLQSKLLKDLVQENPMFDSIPEGSNHLRSRLASNPSVSFLIVMDDIDHVDQLTALLVRDLLVDDSRSLIIVTTRDESVLRMAGINSRYKMKEMNTDHSRELFCWNAFHQPYPTSGYEDLLDSFVTECGGLPLSLQVLGGHVFGSASKHYWNLELGKVRKTLKQDIKRKLRISLESLDNEQMQAFMDIACFFVNKSRHMALRMLEASGWSAEHTLQTLMDKCLVEVKVGRTYWNGFDSESIPLLSMHNHMRDLGRELANDELSSPHRVWRSQHLRSQEEKGFENVLAEMSGRGFRCLNSIFDQHTALQFRYFLGSLNDCEGPSTSLLWLELDSSLLENLGEHENIEEEFISSVSYSHTIPSWIPLQSLQYLKISQGCFQRLWQFDHQVPLQLKDLILEGTNLEEFPNSLGKLSHLENLILAGRVEWNGTEWNNSMSIQGRFFSESLTKLPNLKNLVLKDFTLSGELSFKNSMVNLERIDIRDVKHISKVSISGQYLVNLKFLHLECMENLIEVDLGLDAKLNTEGHSEIEGLPDSTSPCCLKTITVDGCCKLQKISGVEELRGLKYLHLSAGTVPIWDCIKLWQKVPSEVTSLIWKLNVDTESILQKFKVLSYCIGRVTEIPSNPQAGLVIPKAEQTSAIIIFMLIESFYEGKDCRKSLKIPPMDSMVSYIGKGKYIVAVVVNEEEKIIKMQSGMSNWIPMVSNGTVRKGFIVTIQKKGEWKTLRFLRHLCSQEAISVDEVCRWHFSEQNISFKFRYFSDDGVSGSGFCRRNTPLSNGRFQLKRIAKTIQKKKSSCKNPSTFLLWLEVEFTFPQMLDDLENVVRKVMTSESSPLTGPPRIQLQSFKYLKISGGCFRRLWPSDERAPFQLKELVLDGVTLEEFPNSLEMLGHLENLVIAGTKWKNSITINGRSFSESLWKLSYLRSLVLRNLTLIGELSFEASMVSTTLGAPVVKLEKMDIRNVEFISKNLFGRQCRRSHKSLHLQDWETQMGTGLTEGYNYFRNAKSNPEGCSKIEVLQSSGCQCCLKTIQVMEELKGLKFNFQTLLQLRVLVLVGITLEKFPNSLEMLSHLENLVIEGTEGVNCITINGYSFSVSLMKLSNLRSLVLSNLTLSGELSLKDSIVSTTLGTPVISLEKIDIRSVELICKVSISGQYIRSLKSLHLQNLGSLNKVDLGVAHTQNFVKDAKSNKEGCSEIQELPSSGCQCCLETIIVYECWMLHQFKGIEELKVLKYLHLSARTVPEMECRDIWQGLPSHVTCLIWGSKFRGSKFQKLDSEMKEKFEASVQSPRRRVIKIPSDPEEELVIPVTEETSAIVIFMSVKDCPPKGWKEFIGVPPMEGWEGWKDVAVLLREKGKMKNMPHWIRSGLRGKVDVVSLVTFGKTEETPGALLEFCNKVLIWDYDECVGFGDRKGLV